MTQQESAISSATKMLIDTLRKHKLTVSFAESCTGGKLSSWITEVAGVSEFFLGAVVTYSNESKQSLLGVQSESLKTEGAVSEVVARQMAQGVRKKLNSNWSVSITGIAGPSGGTSDKPIGTVWFAISGPNVEVASKKKFEGSRVEIQIQSALYALEFLNQSINKCYL